MLIFVVLLFVPILMQHLAVIDANINYKKKNQRAITAFFIILTLALMLRHESVGYDTGNYIRYFEKISYMSWGEAAQYSVELGFTFLTKILSLISDSAHLFLAVVSLVTCALMYPTYRRNCTDASLTIVLFCTMATFVMMFSGIRQMLAISVGFLAYECTRKRKPWLFLLSVLAAMLCHTSGLMLIFMYPIYYAKITKKWLKFVIPIMLSVFLFNEQIFFALTYILSRFTKYDGVITQTGAYTMLILFTAFSVFSFIIPDEKQMDEETVGLRNFLLFALMLQMFAPLHTIAMRMNYYYIIFIPLLIPRIILCKRERWKQVAVTARYVMVAFFAVYFFISLGFGNNLGVFPYHFLWENVL